MSALCGIRNHPEAASIAYLMAYAVQHRGQESTQIVSSNSKGLASHGGNGHVREVFPEEILQEQLHGDLAIACNSSLPFVNDDPHIAVQSKSIYGEFALSLAGRIFNAHEISRKLNQRGAALRTGTNSDLLVHLIAMSGESDFLMALHSALGKIKGAYAFLAINKGKLYAARDPYGFWPLYIGQIPVVPRQLGNTVDNTSSCFVVSSESCSFDLVGAKMDEEVVPGRIVVINKGVIYKGENLQIHQDKVSPTALMPKQRGGNCIFELIYNGRPDSVIFGRSVESVRYRMGFRLAVEHPVQADIVMPAGDSAREMAIGYSEGSGTPLVLGFVGNHYVWRSLGHSRKQRKLEMRIKFNPVREALKGRRVALIVNSILRCERAKYLAKLLKSPLVGARAVHILSGCPLVVTGCEYGQDLPRTKEMIASRFTEDKIRTYLTKANSVSWLSLSGLLWAVRDKGNEFCSSCLTGKSFEFADLG